MIIALTGTPGTGKTSISRRIADRWRVISVGELARDVGCILSYDPERDSYEIDIPTLKWYVSNYLKNKDEIIVLEGHLSHFLDPDYIVILRTKPSILKKRLEDRGYGHEKVWENVEAEAIDLILIESLEILPKERIFELDTSDITDEETAEMLMDIIDALEKGDSARIEALRNRYNLIPEKIDWSEDFMGLW